MEALCWHGDEGVRADAVPDPTVLNSRDAITRITRTAIRGSGRHLYDGYMPTVEAGGVLGFMGGGDTGRDATVPEGAQASGLVADPDERPSPGRTVAFRVEGLRGAPAAP